jgi:quercetin dioxygenase-like cupin family protein
MKISQKRVSLAIAILCMAVTNRVAHAQTAADPPRGKTGGQSHIAFSHSLPQLDGGHLDVKVVEVTYGPGGSSGVHSHPCPVIGYVVEGALRVQVEGESERIYKAGELFYEAPHGAHLVSANASQEVPARLLAYFVCDHETPLTVPVQRAKPDEGK